MLVDLWPATTVVHRSRGVVPLVVLCLVPAALWLGDRPLDERFSGSYTTLTSLAVLLAATGMTAFALNLVLGARLRVVQALLGGLDRMYVVHRRLGETAVALLLAHVVLVLAGRATISSRAAVELLGPGAGWSVFAGVVAFAGITAAILLTLFARLGHEVFVYVQRTFGILFMVGAYHAFTMDSSLGSPASSAYLAAISTVGVAAFGYRSVFGRRLVRRRAYRVVAVNRLDDVVTEIVMRPVRKPVDHDAGQFVFVCFHSLALTGHLRPFELSVERQVLAIRPGDIRDQFHPFSITSAPGAPELRITVKALGDYTSALRRLEPGAEALVEGPYGTFSPRRLSGSRQLWIAGGIGVTPFLSMARSLAPEAGPAVDFYYCVEHAEEALFLAELRAIERSRPGFRVTVVPRDEDGFLTGERIGREHGDLGETDVLVCGPPAMIGSLRAQLLARGVAPERFHAEEFSFARVGGASSAGREEHARASAPAARSDGRLPALLVAAVAVALAFALGVAVGGSLASDDPSRPSSPAPAASDSGAGR